MRQNMLYHLNNEQFKKLSDTHLLVNFMNAEMLMAQFTTDMNIVKEILPRPLEPTSEALAMAFVARYPESNFGCTYNEGALSILCKYKGEVGTYCLSMPVDDDTGMVSGRELYGYPKKIADKITLDLENNHIIGSVIRKNVEIIKIEGQLGSEISDNVFGEDAIADWDGVPSFRMLSFLFKYFQSPSGSNFDYFPRLIRQPVLFRKQGKIIEVTGRVTLSSTMYDPLGEVPVGKIVKMFYGKWNNTMLPGKVVARIWNPIKFARYAFFKTDVVPFLLSNYNPNLSARAKEIMKIAKRF
jgi:acetoacetate decarboxylase